MAPRTPLLALLCGASLVGCVGQLGDDGGADGVLVEGEPAFSCADAGIEPSAGVLGRLSRRQYDASLRALAVAVLGQEEGDLVLDAVSSTLQSVPVDVNADHARLDQAVSQAHVDGQYRVAVAFASQLVATPARVEALAGACATNADPSDDASCLDAFVRSFGGRAHRRPLSDEEVAFYRDEVFAPADGMDPLALRDVITVMVLSPWFLYRVEDQGAAVDGREDLFTLSGHELAARLAFHFWDAPPDEELVAAAESGALDTEDGYRAEVERVAADPRTRATIDRFYAEWLLLDDLAPLDGQLDNGAYAAFVGDDVPTETLRDEVLEDTLALVRHTTWDAGGDLDELFLTNRSFATTPAVAALYGGVPLWQPGAEPPVLEGGQRAGILTRPAMLATGSTLTHPILRGREIRRRVLCDEIPAPPADAMNDLPELDPLMSERARVAELTESGSCAGCHSQMNPIGYTLGAFDGLGRVRTQETLWGPDGAVLAEHPLDTTATPRIGTEEETISDGVALSELVVESGKPHACFTRHYFRFTYGREEDDERDGCALETMRAELRAGRPVGEVLVEAALSPAFRQRKITP